MVRIHQGACQSYQCLSQFCQGFSGSHRWVPMGTKGARIAFRLRQAYAVPSPPWLTDLSRAFRAHRQGREGWHIQINRDRLRVTSAELPPRGGEPASAARKRSITLRTPPGPSTITAALAEACAIFDGCMAGTWTWPAPGDPGPDGIADPAAPANLQRLITQLHAQQVGEAMTESTWQRTWSPYLTALVTAAGNANGSPAPVMLAAYLRRWPPNTRARQMAHDRARALWRHAGWPWPPAIASIPAMNGQLKGAAAPIPS